MTKTQAIVVLIQESRRDTGTRRRMQRTLSALAALEVGDEATAAAMAHLDYWHPDTHQPYPQYRPQEAKR